MRNRLNSSPSFLEPLDARRYMASNFTVNGTDGADQYEIFQSSESIQIYYNEGRPNYKYIRYDHPPMGMIININSKGGADRIKVTGLSWGHGVKINAGSGDDQITIGGLGGYGWGVDGPVTVVGGEGRDQLTIDDSHGYTPHIDDIYRVTSNYIGWGGVTNADVTFDAWEVEYDESMEFAQLKTTDEPNVVQVRSTSAATPIEIKGNIAAEEFVVGGGDIDSNIKGKLTIIAGDGNDTLLFDDAADDGNDAYHLGLTRLRKADAADIFFYGINVTKFDANAGNNIFRIDGVNSPTLIRGGAGDDVYEVGLGSINQIRRELTLDGQSGQDSIVIDDSKSTGNARYDISPVRVYKDGYGLGGIRPINVATVGMRGGQGNDLYAVLPGLGTELTIRGGGQTNIDDGDVLRFGTTNVPLVETTALGSKYLFANARPIFISGMETVPSYGASISGILFHDKNGNGHRDAPNDGLLTGRAVYIDLDNDQVPDANEPKTVTNGDGKYLFLGLSAGTYKVRQVLGANWQQTTPSNGYGQNVTVGVNEKKIGVNFGSRMIQ